MYSTVVPLGRNRSVASYQLHELHRTAWVPFARWLQGTASLLAPSGNALSCINPLAADGLSELVSYLTGI